jgi:hypothetical protein
MIKATASEIKSHFLILEKQPNAFELLSTQYSEHLLSCLIKWYNNVLYHDASLAHEAVYETLRFYFDHPRKFNPEHGSLKVFLELCSDRMMQNIFRREGIETRSSSIQHLLAFHFDNERDIELARLILKNKSDVPLFVNLLDIGSYRIEQQLAEIGRHIKRIDKILSGIRFPARRRRSSVSRVL